MEIFDHLKLLTILLFSSNLTFAILCDHSNDHLNYTNYNLCIFNGIKTSETNWYFYPSAKFNSSVIYVNFTNSVMPTLTNELCMIFPNLNRLSLESLSMKIITPNALNQCTSLEDISFRNNSLESLKPNLFKTNRKLTRISLGSNLLKTIDGFMFEFVPQLEVLNLSYNYLVDFPLHQFPHLQKMQALIINNNNLVDLDEMKIIQKFPYLKEIHLHNNRFDCNRLAIIVKVLKDKKIIIQQSKMKDIKNRNTNLSIINGVECVPFDDFEEEENYKQFLIVVNIVLFGLNIILSAFLCVMSRKTLIEIVWMKNFTPDEDDYYEFTGFEVSMCGYQIFII